MKRLFIFILVLVLAINSNAQEKWSVEMARTAINTWPDSFLISNDKFAKWRYDQGVILKGIEGVWYATGDGEWFDYIQKCMDFYVGNDGSIRGYRQDEFNIDHLNNGKILLLLYRVTGKEKYKKAADRLRAQINNHPRTSKGGFWHKKIYPSQMWLDGLYMGQPFYAEYASLFHEALALDDITLQFVLMEQHSRDAKTGLLYHGWDESKEQKWADPVTGRSPNFWGRALGWYGMAIVDALDHFPSNHKGRDSLINILNRFAKAVTAVQDAGTGLWYDVVDKGAGNGNYFEASASCMLVYTLAKGVRMGYLPESYITNADKGYKGIVKEFVKVENGQANLHGTVSVSGLGGKPYRDGSFEYYMSEPVVVNDPKGVGAFIKAAVEMEMIQQRLPGKRRKVLFDYHFNNEWKKDITGEMVRWHYTLNDKSNSGYSLLGHLFNRRGAITCPLESAPTKKNLAGADVYIFVDPDTEKETERPNFIEEKDISAIEAWVSKGGVLVLLGNDAGNAEFTHFNKLAAKFGIKFNEDRQNLVEGNKFEQGAVVTPAEHSIFKQSRKLYIKELSSLSATGNAKVVLEKDGMNIMAVSKHGKGMVFALGDPWIYNEYLDGRKLPKGFENYAAAVDWVDWLLNNTMNKK